MVQRRHRRRLVPGRHAEVRELRRRVRRLLREDAAGHVVPRGAGGLGVGKISKIGNFF